VTHGGAGSPAAVPSSLSGGTGYPTHSRQGSSSSPSGNPARMPPSPITTGFGVHPSPPAATSTFAPSSLGDKRPGTSGSGASSDKDRRISISSARGGDENEEPRPDGPMPMPMPTRKRYSSSFGYRYVGSVGSATSVPIGSVPGSGSNEGRSPVRGGSVGAVSTPGSVNDSERGVPASGSGQAGKREVSNLSSALLFMCLMIAYNPFSPAWV